jgi:hypothetical protein
MANNRDWISHRDAELVTQAEDMSAKVTADFAALGLANTDATALASATTSYVNAYNLAKDDATRTPLTIEDMSVAKAALIARMRGIGARVRANPNVSNSLKLSLGLRIPDRHPSTVPAPATAPVNTVISTNGRTVRARIADSLTPNSKQKAVNASEYEVFTHVGDTAPADIYGWTYQGQGTRNIFEVTLPNSVASGSKVWICTRWCNRRGAAGPVSAPVATIVVGTVAEGA